MDTPATDILISRLQIEAKIKEIAGKIARDFKGKNLVVIAVLNGSLLLSSDLIRVLWENGLTDVSLDTVCLKSYTSKTSATQKPVLLKDVSIDLKDRNVLVVEDIIDTGLTLTTLLELLRKRSPASLKTCTLLSKPYRRKVKLEADYTGFVIDDLWVEGFGLDTNGKFRGNPDITYRKN